MPDAAKPPTPEEKAALAVAAAHGDLGWAYYPNLYQRLQLHIAAAIRDAEREARNAALEEAELIVWRKNDLESAAAIRALKRPAAD